MKTKKQNNKSSVYFCNYKNFMFLISKPWKKPNPLLDF